MFSGVVFSVAHNPHCDLHTGWTNVRVRPFCAISSSEPAHPVSWFYSKSQPPSRRRPWLKNQKHEHRLQCFVPPLDAAKSCTPGPFKHWSWTRWETASSLSKAFKMLKSQILSRVRRRYCRVLLVRESEKCQDFWRNKNFHDFPWEVIQAPGHSARISILDWPKSFWLGLLIM